MQKIYFDPMDEPKPGMFALMVDKHDRRLTWRGATVDEALRKFLTDCDTAPEDILFRRVELNSGDDSYHVWEVDGPRSRAPKPDDPQARLLGCFEAISTLARTVKVSPAIGAKFGVVEVYMRSDSIASNFSYLDRSGKIRPVTLEVDGDAIEEGADEDFVREEIEDGIEQALEPVFQYPVPR